MGEWVRACDAGRVGDGQLLGVCHGGRRILLANRGGRMWATDLICTHAEADLSEGFLSEEGVRCPLHLSVFGLEDGRPRNPPAEEPLRVYNVKIDRGGVYVEI